MTLALRAVFSLLFGAGLLILGNGLIGILLPIRMGVENVSADLSGIVMSAFYFGFMVGSVAGQPIIRRVGHIRAFAAFAALATAVSMAHALVFDVTVWAILRAISGFCMAALYATIESWLNVKSSNDHRGQVLSIYLVTSYLASLLGQLLVNTYEIEGLGLFCLGGLMMSLSLVPVVLTRVAGPEIGAVKRLGLRVLYKASPLGVVATWGAGMLSGAFYALAAIYADSLDLSVFEISLFISVPIFGGLVLQWPIGRLSDRYDRRTVLLGVLVVCVVSSVVLSFFGYTGAELTTLLVAAVFLGGALATIYPIAVAQAYDYVDRADMVGASGGLLLVWAIGGTVGPLIASFLMGHFEAPALFVYLAVVASALVIFTLYRMLRRQALPAAEQTNFVAVQTTSAIANALDPRTDPLPEFYYNDEDPGDR
ncbi:putative MFS family arabinose efflux permease [Dongia mobilis]|uniref:Putative MFS family arabinose efflux permease n=1 Tax=Dongia mobilis TaxID=578943 RepID=A0A4R6WNG4_9PROT|nr:MFS transporter [Dongia mobilis]TDQ77689.1 putative MFS family arabinose efflux permease [Dongia mobilis]